MVSRRANASKPRPDSLPSTMTFNPLDLYTADLSHALAGNDFSMELLSIMNGGCSFGGPQPFTPPNHQISPPHHDYTLPRGKDSVVPPEKELQFSQSGFPETPPDLVSPAEPDYSSLDELAPVTGGSWNENTYHQLLALSGESDFSTAFEAANIPEFAAPDLISNEFMDMVTKDLSDPCGTRACIPRVADSTKASPASRNGMDVDMPTAPATSPTPPDGVHVLTSSHESWPFFSCNRFPKSGPSPPTTAAIYLKGLTEVLIAHAWPTLHDSQQTDGRAAIVASLQDHRLESSISRCSIEMLNTATKTILSKALVTHSSDRSLGKINDLQTKIRLPPTDAILDLMGSYISHHKKYYPCVSDTSQIDTPILQSNVQASSLLALLQIAQGASFISAPATRYLANGLIEACRLFLFESIEKDILLSHEPTILHSALLFTIAAAWSGDKWHMDIAMGQRGMYLAVSFQNFPPPHLKISSTDVGDKDDEPCWNVQ
jgi:hypothetical protein